MAEPLELPTPSFPSAKAPGLTPCSGTGAQPCILAGGKQVSCCLLGSPSPRMPVALVVTQRLLPTNSARLPLCGWTDLQLPHDDFMD